MTGRLRRRRHLLARLAARKIGPLTKILPSSQNPLAYLSLHCIAERFGFAAPSDYYLINVRIKEILLTFRNFDGLTDEDSSRNDRRAQ